VRVALATVLACGLAVAAGGLLRAAEGAPFEPASRTVLDVGDSLSVGTGPHLRARLPEYRIDRRVKIGLRAHEVAAIVSRWRAALPSVLVVSAGTNDDPRSLPDFTRAVSDIVRDAGGRCIVWPTISRPRVAGLSYDLLNSVLAGAAARNPNLVLVRWARMVRLNPGWLGRDRVHASVDGYRARAEAIATAVKTRCAT
jgi:hypothetical protein